MKNNGLSSYRILAIAILISLGWHLFWLSAVKIVSTSSAGTGRTKFSKVSFLGPILTKVSMEVRVQPAARSFLEKRFISAVERVCAEAARRLEAPDRRKAGAMTGSRLADVRLPRVIDETVSGRKLEPDFGAD